MKWIFMCLIIKNNTTLRKVNSLIPFSICADIWLTSSQPLHGDKQSKYLKNGTHDTTISDIHPAISTLRIIGVYDINQ